MPTEPPNDPAPTPAPCAASPRQVALGLFVLGQLAFLVLSNLIGLYQDPRSTLNRQDPEVSRTIERIAPGYLSESGHAWKIPDELSTLLRRWAQLTGQEQAWSLFAPGVYKVTGFPAVVFVWEEPFPADAVARTAALWAATDALDAAALAALLELRPDELHPPAVHIGPGLASLAAAHPEAMRHLRQLAQDGERPVRPSAMDMFLSDNEPADARHFLRLGKFRLRKYETGLVPYLRDRPPETDAERLERWRGEIRSHVDDNTEYLLTYLKWRLATYQERHPERGPPGQVLLVERNYKILPPDDDTGAAWEGPTMMPLARWQPDAEVKNGQRRLERYDPVEKRFETSWK